MGQAGYQLSHLSSLPSVANAALQPSTLSIYLQDEGMIVYFRIFEYIVKLNEDSCYVFMEVNILSLVEVFIMDAIIESV